MLFSKLEHNYTCNYTNLKRVYWFHIHKRNKCTVSPEEFTTQAQLKEVEKLSEESSTAVNVESRQRSVRNSTIQGAGGSNVLQHTKSLLQLAPNGEVTCEKVEAASTQFNALMIEVYVFDK